VRVRAGGGESPFAIASAPSPERTIELLAKRGATVANALCALAPGDRVEIASPEGPGFPLGEARGRALILVAAGSGVGPMRAVVQQVIARRSEYTDVILFYGQRAHEDFAFFREYAGWEAAAVRVIRVVSRATVENGGMGGYVQDALRSLRPDTVHAVAFLSGMRKMIDGVTNALIELGLSREQIYLNY
jgi:NAD(P)H-flavin reductase